MDIVPATYFENLKRYWRRRRRYQRIDGAAHNKKKMKTARLGNKTCRRVWKIRVRKLRFKFVSPIKLRPAGDNDVGLFGGKRIPKGRPVPMVSCRNEIVDGRFVLETYKRLVSSGELPALLV